MSGRWASGSHTVLLDYISALEIVAVFSAMRRKDWAVFIGLYTGDNLPHYPVLIYLSLQIHLDNNYQYSCLNYITDIKYLYYRLLIIES
jgi:hypothetical protein